MRTLKGRANIHLWQVALVIGLVLSTGCSSKKQEVRSTEVIATPGPFVSDPGAVEFVWEAPMVDVVDIPPGVDPEGHYYRPAHQEVVEIRQGRWKYYKLPQR